MGAASLACAAAALVSPRRVQARFAILADLHSYTPPAPTQQGDTRTDNLERTWVAGIDLVRLLPPSRFPSSRKPQRVVCVFLPALPFFPPPSFSLSSSYSISYLYLLFGLSRDGWRASFFFLLCSLSLLQLSLLMRRELRPRKLPLYCTLVRLRVYRFLACRTTSPSPPPSHLYSSRFSFCTSVCVSLCLFL